MQHFRRSPRILARLVLAVIVAVALLTGARAERLGDRYQVALPLLGLACAAASGSAPDYVLRYAVLWTGIRASKNALGRSPINLRPHHGDGGMPSGHTASASFGASALVHGCLAASPPARLAAVVAAGFTGASRISAEKHTIWQVLAGVLWALVCERALRSEGASRAAVAQLRRAGSALREAWPTRAALMRLRIAQGRRNRWAAVLQPAGAPHGGWRGPRRTVTPALRG